MMNNYGCMGYIKLAARRIGMKDSEIGRLLDSVYYMFDIKTETEAEQAYYDIRLDREDDENGL